MSVTAEPSPLPRKRSVRRRAKHALSRAQRRVKKALRSALMALGLATIPYLYLAYMWLVYRTSRVETVGPHPGIARRDYGRAVFALWHQEVFFVAYGFGEYHPDTLASQGDSGAIITRMLKLCGYNVFRGGSSSGDRRRSVGVIDDLVERMQRTPGVIYGITTDGSKGPVHRMKRGAVQIAATTGAPVVVFKTWCKRYFLLPTWDRTMIPLPFNHISYVFAGPFWPQAELPEAERFEVMYGEVERALCAVSAWARRREEGLPLPQDWIDSFPESVREEMARAEEPVLFRASGAERIGS
jgi:lysophospholipid acyltransferase (LPLAT)-like uncharacterized protein